MARRYSSREQDTSNRQQDIARNRAFPSWTLGRIFRLRGATVGWFSLVISTLVGSASQAGPEGGQVTAGSATINQTSPTRLDINQSSDRAIIDWRSFSIDRGEQVHFQQPQSQSVTLNRVRGNTPSNINGWLTANGQIFLINRNGIVFGKDAKVNVGGLLATTADIRNEDFMAGRYLFNQPSDNPNASVINYGQIQVSDGGMVVLAAPGVRNEGLIGARLGQVELAGVNTFTLDFHGDGLLQFGLGSEVTQQPKDTDGKPLDALVANAGVIEANGGVVALTARGADAVVDRVINMDGVVQAQAVTTRGGMIVLEGGDRGIVSVTGTLDASGPNAGQTGGTVKVLGEKVELFDSARIDASGKSGNGTWLLGPTTSITIDQAYANVISNTLNTGTDVTLNSNTVILQEIGAPISKTAGGSATLSLNAGYDITLNDSITATVGQLHLNLNGAGGNGTGMSQIPGVTLSANIDSGGGDINIIGTGYGFQILSGIGIDVRNTEINAKGGNITFIGTSVSFSNLNSDNVGINMVNSVVQTTDSIIKLTGVGGNGGINNNFGIIITGTSQVNSVNGDIILDGRGGGDGTGVGNFGISVRQSSTVEATGMGKITLTGIGGTGTDSNQGVVTGNDAIVRTADGDINIFGTGGTGSNNYGIYTFFANGAIETTGSGSILLEGKEAPDRGIGIIRDQPTSKTTIKTSGSGNLTLKADRIELSDNTEINTKSGGKLTLMADEINLGSNAIISGSGLLQLEPKSNSLNITLGGAVDNPQELNLTTSELDTLQSGFSQMIIGNNEGTGTISIDSAGLTFKDNITLQSPGATGNVLVNGPLQTNGKDLTLTAGETVTLNGDNYQTNGGSFTVNGDTLLASNTTINTINPVNMTAGNIIFYGLVDGTNTLTLQANNTGSISLNGKVGSQNPLSSLDATGISINLHDVTTGGNQTYRGVTTMNGNYLTGGGAFTIEDRALLAGNTIVNSGGEAITFNGTVDSSNSLTNYSLTLMQAGDIFFNGAVGSQKELNSLDVTGDSITLQDVTTLGNQTYTGATTLGGNYTLASGDFKITGNTTLVKSTTVATTSAGNMTFGDVFARNGESLTLSAAGNITVDNIFSNGSNDSGRIVLNTDNGIISVNSLYSLSNIGNGGDITLRARDININNSLDSSSNQDAGKITLNASNNININKFIDSVSRGGKNGGEINVTAGNGITIGSYLTSASDGTAGNGGRITLTATNGTISVIDIDSKGANSSGAITLSAGNSITADSLVTYYPNGSNGADIILTANTGNISIIHEVDSSSDTQNGGKITLKAGNNIDTGSFLQSFSNNGQGGQIDITAGNNISIVGLSSLSKQNGEGGNITLTAGGDINIYKIPNFPLAIESISYAGMGGGRVNISAGGNLSIFGELHSSYNGIGGEAVLESIRGIIKTDSPIFSSSLTAKGTSISLKDVTTVGNQDYSGPLTLSGSYKTNGGNFTANNNALLSADTTINTAGGTISFNGLVDGANALTLQAGAGNISLSGAVGSQTPLSSLNAAGNAVSVHNVTTQGNQRYAGSVTSHSDYLTGGGDFTVDGNFLLTDATTVNTSGGTITFNGTINGANPLTLQAGLGNIFFNGDVGTSIPLGPITIAGAQDIRINGRFIGGDTRIIYSGLLTSVPDSLRLVSLYVDPTARGATLFGTVEGVSGFAAAQHVGGPVGDRNFTINGCVIGAPCMAQFPSQAYPYPFKIPPILQFAQVIKPQQAWIEAEKPEAPTDPTTGQYSNFGNEELWNGSPVKGGDQ